MSDSESGTEVPQEGNTKPLGAGEDPKKKKPEKARLYCFTSFYPDPIEFRPEQMLYLAYGAEICPTTGRDHWQGFVYWKNPRTLNGVKKEYRGIHWEICRGSLDQNEVYCSKEEKYTTFGTKPHQGSRVDLQRCVDKIMLGSLKVDDIIVNDSWTFHSFGRTLDRAEDLFLLKQYRTEMTKCTWLYGPTGVGKSHQALASYTPESHYVLNV